MIAKEGGFYVHSLAVVGQGKPKAELLFDDGLNVVAGASDTGKSFALSCLDFAFGASKPPRAIAQLVGYTHVVVTLIVRKTREHISIERQLSGGDVKVIRSDFTGSTLSTETLPCKHSGDDPKTLSGVLLEICDLWGKRVRKNAKGEMRSLSFRDIAFLCLVDEERIITERPPQLSGSVVEKTVELDVFRLLVTGVEQSEQVRAPQTKKDAVVLAAKLELLESMIAGLRAEMNKAGVNFETVDAELASLEDARQATFAAYQASRESIVELEEHLADYARTLREIQSRVLVVDGLTKRFHLLQSHYESDLNRLQVVHESGRILEAFPEKPCPLCGAEPNEHRADHCEAQYRLPDLQSAAELETAKVEALKGDLQKVLNGLASERSILENRRSSITTDVQNVQLRLNAELAPRAKETLETLKLHDERRELLRRAKNLSDQLTQLLRQADEITKMLRRKGSSTRDSASASTADMEAFAGTVERLLREWKYPDVGRVVFSEESQDLVINGHPRAAHGKGVRALTCAAFITGVLRHCLDKGLPHTSVVALDSPLVAYKEPDTGDQESQKMRKAGVKEAFYTTLASGSVGSQIIVFENEDPPPDLKGCRREHFSKVIFGRYGFFSVDFGAVEVTLAEEHSETLAP